MSGLETAMFAGEIVRPGDPDYDVLRRGWNAIHDRRPALIAKCASAGDVSAAIRLARDDGLPICVYGGGHSFPGHSIGDHGRLTRHG
jgi:FAD/FMN-containing dehydrogenase